MIDQAANPEMLTLAREARGMSQEALAEKAGVSQGYLSKVENGLLDVSGDRLAAIARALDYPVEFFHQGEQKASVEALFNRRLRSVKVSDLKQMQAQINVTRIHVKRLMQGTNIQAPYVFPRLDVDDVGGPEIAAQLVRRAWNMPLGPVLSVVRSIEAAGGVVVPLALASEKVSAAAQWPRYEERPYFFVNASHPGDRQRFSLAHEIGHMVLHVEPGLDQEHQADQFASEFLMPKREIEQQLRGKLTPARLLDLKQYWKVSMAALIKRAKDLEVIDDARATSLFKLMSARGWRRVEPGLLPPERPDILAGVIATHTGRHGYSLEDLGKLALLSPAEFSRLFLRDEGGSAGPGADPRRALRAVP